MAIEIIGWILLISVFTLFGSWYVRRYERSDAIVGLYVAFILFSNIAAQKIAEFNLGFTTLFSPAVVLIFSVTFLMTDIVNERFGRKETQRMIFIGFISQVAITAFTFLLLYLKPAPFWGNQAVFESLFGQVPRIIFASYVAFLTSENLDAYIFDWFKRLTRGKHLWARNVFSSLPSMAVDSVLFLAISGFQPFWSLVIGLTTSKWLVGIIDIPFMYLNRLVMYKK